MWHFHYYHHHCLHRDPCVCAGLLEAAGKEARWRSESDLKEAPGDGERGPPSPAASSSSSHASRRPTPPPLAGPGAGLRAGSDPSLARPDPSGRLQPAPAPPTGQGHHGRGLAAKLSPRLGGSHFILL